MTKAQDKAHEADVRKLADLMLKQANERGLHDGFRKMVDELNAGLTVKLPELQTQSEFQASISLNLHPTDGGVYRSRNDITRVARVEWDKGPEAFVAWLGSMSPEYAYPEFDSYNFSVRSSTLEWAEVSAAEAETEVAK